MGKAEVSFEDLFRSGTPARDNLLSRLFGMFSEEVARHWCSDERSPYENLGRPTLGAAGDPASATLDFTFRSRTDGRVYVAEQKAELAFECYRYLRLIDAAQVEHHKTRAFAWFLEMARDPASHSVQVNGRLISADGAILVWGATTSEGVASAIATYGFADVLSLEAMLADLRAWDSPAWVERVDQLRGWSNELFEAL